MTMPEDIPFWICGAGGHGRVVADAARACGIVPAGFIDDRPHGGELDGLRVLATTDPAWLALKAFSFVVAIGENCIRARIFRRLAERGGVPRTLVHPAATVSPRATLGPGTVVFAGAVVNPGAIVGANCILNTACSVDHDCRVADHAHLCPGVRLAGTVDVGEGVMIGTGAVVIPGRRIGAWAMAGAGAVVVRHVPSARVAIGNPARAIHPVAPEHLPEGFGSIPA